MFVYSSEVRSYPKITKLGNHESKATSTEIELSSTRTVSFEEGEAMEVDQDDKETEREIRY